MSALVQVETPEQMLARALDGLEHGMAPAEMLAVADRWIAKWSRLVEEEASGIALDGRTNIYTGETYAEGRARWAAYRDLLIDHLRGPDGGGQ